ncbi:MAG TPA: hypothetical protein VID76_01330 [Solirubrobacterales bacterium]
MISEWRTLTGRQDHAQKRRARDFGHVGLADGGETAGGLVMLDGVPAEVATRATESELGCQRRFVALRWNGHQGYGISEYLTQSQARA